MTTVPYKVHLLVGLVEKESNRADLLQADLDRVDDLHAAECAGYKARIEELEAFIGSLINYNEQEFSEEIMAVLEKTK